MKIALCISGYPKGLYGGIKMLKENLIEPSNIIDVFVHLWYHSSLDGTPFNSSQPHQDKKIGTWQPNSDTYVREALNPKRMLVEYPEDMSRFSHLKDVPNQAIQKGLASMFCSVTKANNLKKEYENENGFKYDIVIRSRIDHIYHKKINVAELIDENIDNCIYMPYNHQYMRDGWHFKTNSGIDYISTAETFLFGNSENMDKACSVFPNFENIYNDIYPLNYAEQYIGYQITVANKLKPIKVDAPYDIYRGE